MHGALSLAVLNIKSSYSQPTETSLESEQDVPDTLYRGNEFALRSPLWWRDLLLGLTFGIALFWFFADVVHWEDFRKHIVSELIFISVPLGLALLSPRRLLTVFLGFCILLFRLVFIIFLFQSFWSALRQSEATQLELRWT